MRQRTDPTPKLVLHAAMRMKTWADANPWCDTQGITGDEWESLAAAALGFDEPHPREDD